MSQNEQGFCDGVDLRFGAIDTTNVNRKRGRDREIIRKVPKHFKYNKYIEKKKYVCMGNARTCDMQKKLHTSKMQDNTIIMLM